MGLNLADWADITSNIAAQRRGPSVTIAWRRPGKGRPALEFCVNAKLAEELGWSGGVRARLRLSPAGDAIAFTPDDTGLVIRARGRSCVVGHRPEWIPLDMPARPAEAVEHQVHHVTLIVTLPEWARRGGQHAPATAPAVVSRSPVAAPPSGLRQDKLTPARAALFRTLWPDLSLRLEEIAARLYALPGEPYSPGSLAYIAKRLEMPTARTDYVSGGRAAMEEKRAGTDQRTEDEREAEALVRADPKSWHGRAIAEEFGWKVEEGAAFVTRIRAKIEGEKAAAE